MEEPFSSESVKFKDEGVTNRKVTGVEVYNQYHASDL